jgi:hypothetical protein
LPVPGLLPLALAHERVRRGPRLAKSWKRRHARGRYRRRDVRLDPATMPRVGTVGERLQSYNVEMAEVIGGTFWKPYAARSQEALADPPFCTPVTGPVRTLGHAQMSNSVGRLGHPGTTILSEPVRPGRSAIADRACSGPGRRGRFWYRRVACASRDLWATLPISGWRGSPKSGAGWRIGLASFCSAQIGLL